MVVAGREVLALQGLLIWIVSGRRGQVVLGDYLAFLGVLLLARPWAWTFAEGPDGRRRTEGKEMEKDRLLLRIKQFIEYNVTPVHLMVQVEVPAPGTPSPSR